MRGFVTAIAVALGVTGVALAAPPTTATKAAVLTPGMAVTYGGMTCTAYSGTTATNANLVCVRNNLKGYGVVISQDSVIVAKQVGTKFSVVFKRKNS